MGKLRTFAILTWIYAAGFGIPAVPVAVYLNRQGRLPTFAGLFPMYGGPWSSSMPHTTFIVVLLAFLATMLVVSWTAGLVWRGSRFGAVLAVVLLPIEAVFWIGFALPLPWLSGVARAIFLAWGWTSLRRPATSVDVHP